MPYTIRIFPEHALAVLTFTGEASGKTFMEAKQALLAHPDWRPGYDRLWNELGIEMVAAGYPEAKEYGRFTRSIAERVGSGRSAIVAAEPVHHRLNVLYKVLIPWQSEVFHTVEEALAWLGKRLDAEVVRTV